MSGRYKLPVWNAQQMIGHITRIALRATIEGKGKSNWFPFPTVKEAAIHRNAQWKRTPALGIVSNGQLKKGKKVVRTQ